MPSTNANTVLYATRPARYPMATIANATAANTTTLIATADSYGSVLTDILFRSADTAVRNFEIIIATTGSQGSTNPIVQVSIPANSGNNGSTAIASLAALAPSIFDIDLAGNRTIGLESGMSIYVKNTALTTGAFYFTAKVRDYTP